MEEVLKQYTDDIFTPQDLLSEIEDKVSSNIPRNRVEAFGQLLDELSYSKAFAGIKTETYRKNVVNDFLDKYDYKSKEILDNFFKVFKEQQVIGVEDIIKEIERYEKLYQTKNTK